MNDCSSINPMKGEGNTMTGIKTIIRPFKLLEVTEELHKIAGLRRSGKKDSAKAGHERGRDAIRIKTREHGVRAVQQGEEMKRSTVSLSVILLLTILSGCGAAAKTIAARSTSERSNVFVEVFENDSAPSGYADVLIRANIKTPVGGYSSGESKTSVNGKETYPFLINIDGQAALWRAEGKKHELPRYVDGITSRDPEAGSGMKYVLAKKVRLAAGTHKVFFGLPDEPYYTEADIIVASGNAYVLEFQPKYWHKKLPTRIPTFVKGVNHYDILINGNPAARYDTGAQKGEIH